MNHQAPEDFLKQHARVEYLDGHGPYGEDPPPSDFDPTEYTVDDLPSEPKLSRKSAEHVAHPEKMRVIDPRNLAGQPVPERQWIVFGYVPVGYTTALYGDGGTGKTLLAQQLMTSCATGMPWLGVAVTPCKVFGLFCEDDETELHRRQDAINSHSGLNFSDLGNMQWVSGVGADNLLMSFSADGRALRTGRLDDLTAAVMAFDARLVVIDTAADTFGGNENDRSQVRQFIGAGLNRLAQDIGGAVLLCAHPSRSGMSAVGDLDGGSTGWSNSVRSRLSLVRPKGDDETPADTDERILGRRKANYAAIGAEVRLQYVSGILAPVQRDGTVSGAINRAAAEATFLELLEAATAANRPVSDSKNAGSYAPTVFAQSPNRNGYTKVDFRRAMEGLFAEGRLAMESYGRKGDHRRRMVATTPQKGGGDE